MADALRAFTHRFSYVFRRFNISLQADNVPVFGLGRQRRQLGELNIELAEFFLIFAMLGKLFGVRVDNDDAAVAVEDDQVTAADS